MKLSKIHSTGCRSIPDGEYSLLNASGGPADFVVVTGPSGCGKTSFLELILATKEVIGPYVGSPNVDSLLRQGAAGGRVQTEWELTAEEASSVGLPNTTSTVEALYSRSALSTTNADPGIAAILARFATNTKVGIVDYFADDRQLPMVPLAQELSEFELKRGRLQRGARKYESTAVFARKALTPGADPEGRGAAVRHLLGLLMPYLKPVGVNGRGMLEFHRANGEAVTVDRLSASEKQMLIFAATPVMLGVKESMILIDTPELFLGRGEAARLIGTLRDNLPPNQWIVATRDPELVGLAEQGGAVVTLGTAS